MHSGTPVSSPDRPLLRSYLFAPGNDALVMRKALGAGADAVVLDLEDSVPAELKGAARATVAALLAEHSTDGSSDAPGGPELHIRVNRSGDGYDRDDLRVAVSSPLVRAVRLPKTDGPEMVRAAAAILAEAERDHGRPIGSTELHPTIESARGVLECRSIAASDPRVTRVVLGHADLLADLGAQGDDALALLVPASLVVLASRAEGIGSPIDGAFTDVIDEDGLRASLARARALGMFGKSAIHPRQLPAIHEAHAPTIDELRWAGRVVTSLTAAEHDGSGVALLDGAMIDLAIVRRAEGLLALRRDS